MAIIIIAILAFFLIRGISKGVRKSKAHTENITYSQELNDIDYMDGHSFEYWCADLLQYCGFVDVRVTPGSGDQGVDILAKRDGKSFAIQCKRYNSNLGNTPIQEVNTGRAIYGCDYAAVMTNRYFTAGAVQAARAVGVLLWNRDSIQQMLDQKRKVIFQKSKEYKHQQRIERRRNKADAIAQINEPSFFYCYNCGTKLIEGTRFCSTCGKPQ